MTDAADWGFGDDDVVVPLATAMPGVLSRASVMVVDDNVENLELLERVMRAAGVPDVRSFTDPREAVVACTEARPDIVLLDLHMPHIDGLGVMSALKESLPEGSFLPVVVVTADVSAVTRRRVLDAGAKDFLTKPYSLTEVVLRVRNLLETVELHRRLEERNVELHGQLEEREAQERRAVADLERRTGVIEALIMERALQVVFQPIADVDTGVVVGAEALARFSAEPQQPPDVWFAEAAAVGLGVELELAAIDVALEQLPGLPPDVFLSLNVSPATVASSALAERLAGTSAERLVLELTEHERVDDYGALLSAVGELRGHGTRLAVDDTGSGWAGLEHILRLGADILKLDMGLTRGIDVDPVRRALAAALVAFARDTGSTIIAEGIETAEELAALGELGVAWGQGYHLGRPASLPLVRRTGSH